MKVIVCGVFFKIHPSKNINMTFGVLDKNQPKCLPTVELSGGLENSIDSLCDKFVDVEPSWLEKTQASFFEENETVYLVYRINVPFNVNLKSGLEWVTYEELIKTRDRFSEEEIKSLSVCTGI
tara:strand:- start:545 stop:913 length:369 start_codon:yes stop_codon:yes gene_type:complete